MMAPKKGKFVQEVAHLIDEIARCPICLERVRSPLCQCQNGHVTCSQCKNQNPRNNCSLCGLPFIVTPPRILSQLLDAFSKACKYSANGCSVPFMVENHEQLCLYRPIKCWLGQDKQCRWTGTVKDWQEHVKQSHTGLKSNMTINKVTALSYLNFRNWNSFGYCYIVDNSYFLLYVFKQNGMFFQNVRIIPLRKQDSYLFHISLEYTAKTVNNVKTAFSGTFEPSVLLEHDNLEDSHNKAGVPISYIEPMTINGDLPVSIVITKK